MPKKTTVLIMSIVMIISLWTECGAISFAGTSGSLVIKINGTDCGSLYWMKSNKGDYFYENYKGKEFNSKCLLSTNKNYSIKDIKGKGIVAQEKRDCRFMGFFNDNNQAIELEHKEYNILKVKVSGVVYYDMFLSKSNGLYSILTAKQYNDIVKIYLKNIYGTSTYQVLSNQDVYFIPNKYNKIVAKFVTKKTQKLGCSSKLTVNSKKEDYYFGGYSSGDGELSYKSSNKNVATIDKESGLVNIIGPGSTIINVKASGTDKYRSRERDFILKVTPMCTSVSQVTSTSKEKLKISWTKVTGVSGYQIRLSQNSAFKVFKDYTAGSNSTFSKTISKLKSQSKYCLKIRAYKTSRGEKLFSSWSKSVWVKIK